MKRISDLEESEIRPGLRVKSLARSDGIGTVVEIDYPDDSSTWVEWDQPEGTACPPDSCFNWNDCDCEILLDEAGDPVYVPLETTISGIPIYWLNGYQVSHIAYRLKEAMPITEHLIRFLLPQAREPNDFLLLTQAMVSIGYSLEDAQKICANAAAVAGLT